MGVTDYGSASDKLNAPSLADWAASVSAALNGSDTPVNTRIASLEYAPVGITVNVNEVAGAYTRPTSRTDICVVFTGAADPASVALAGDKWDRTS